MPSKCQNSPSPLHCNRSTYHAHGQGMGMGSQRAAWDGPHGGMRGLGSTHSWEVEPFKGCGWTWPWHTPKSPHASPYGIETALAYKLTRLHKDPSPLYPKVPATHWHEWLPCTRPCPLSSPTTIVTPELGLALVCLAQFHTPASDIKKASQGCKGAATGHGPPPPHQICLSQ